MGRHIVSAVTLAALPVLGPVVGYPATPAAVADEADSSFKSPDANIVCFSIQKYVHCDIKEKNWTPAADPSGCGGEAGQGVGISLPSGAPAHFTCYGGGSGNAADAPVLEYGQTHSMPYYHCDSDESGITCVNVHGNGFTIGREAYRMF